MKVHNKNKAKIHTQVQLWSKNDDVATPDDLYKALNEEFKFDFDPCPLGGKPKEPNEPKELNEPKETKETNEKKYDGLEVDWGKSNYVNPPYSEIKEWLKKAIKEMKKGNKSVFLIPLRLSSVYWEQYVYPYASEIRPIAGYIKFKGYEKIRGLNTPIGLVIYDPVQYKGKFQGVNNVHFSEIAGNEVIAMEW